MEAEDGASFEALLTAHAITEPELRQYLLYAIAMGQHPQEDEAAADHRISAADGIQAVRAYARMHTCSRVCVCGGCCARARSCEWTSRAV